MPSRVESVEVPDGSFALQLWLPADGTGPGLLLIQEIFGISDYIRDVADDLAGLGYVVAAPDLLWRIEPGFDPKQDQVGLAMSL
jgi:carboxymethylenebutenolidase